LHPVDAPARPSEPVVNVALAEPEASLPDAPSPETGEAEIAVPEAEAGEPTLAERDAVAGTAELPDLRVAGGAAEPVAMADVAHGFDRNDRLTTESAISGDMPDPLADSSPLAEAARRIDSLAGPDEAEDISATTLERPWEDPSPGDHFPAGDDSKSGNDWDTISAETGGSHDAGPVVYGGSDDDFADAVAAAERALRDAADELRTPVDDPDSTEAAIEAQPPLALTETEHETGTGPTEDALAAPVMTVSVQRQPDRSEAVIAERLASIGDGVRQAMSLRRHVLSTTPAAALVAPDSQPEVSVGATAIAADAKPAAAPDVPVPPAAGLQPDATAPKPLVLGAARSAPLVLGAQASKPAPLNLGLAATTSPASTAPSRPAPLPSPVPVVQAAAAPERAGAFAAPTAPDAGHRDGRAVAKQASAPNLPESKGISGETAVPSPMGGMPDETAVADSPARKGFLSLGPLGKLFSRSGRQAPATEASLIPATQASPAKTANNAPRETEMPPPPPSRPASVATAAQGAAPEAPLSPVKSALTPIAAKQDQRPQVKPLAGLSREDTRPALRLAGTETDDGPAGIALPEGDDHDADGNLTLLGLARRARSSSLTDLIEVAAAYQVLVADQQRFSRPALFGMIDTISGGRNYTAEARLKSFGKLQRGNRIVRVDDGLFTISNALRSDYQAHLTKSGD
jgi:hypothetical protein